MKRSTLVSGIVALWFLNPGIGFAAGSITIQPDPAPPSLSVPEGGARLTFSSMSLVPVSQAGVANSIVVTRGGTAPAQAFSSIVALDDFGRVIGRSLPNTSGSDTVIALNEPLLPGHSYKIVVAGDFAQDLSQWHGRTVSLAITRINASLPLIGSLPAGATHTIDSITVGSLDIAPVSPINEIAAIGLRQQLFGQFAYNVGIEEPIVVGGTEFNIFSWSSSPLSYTSVVLMEGSTVLAGPIDVTPTSDPFVSAGTFYQFVPLSQGTHILSVRGVVNGSVSPGDMVAVSIDASRIHHVRGKVWGYELVRNGEVFSDSVPVLGPSLVISLLDGSEPATVVTGSRQVQLAIYVLDASNSSEDIRLFQLPVSLFFTGTTDVENVNLYDCGSVASGVFLSTNATQRFWAFAFTNALVVRRGEVKLLILRADVLSAPGATMQWGVVDTGGNIPGQCAVSALPITTHFIANPGQVTTVIASGSLTILPSPTLPRRIQGGVNSTLVEFVLQANDESVNGNGATIDVPITLTRTNGSGGTSSLLDLNPIQVVSTSGTGFASRVTLTLTPSTDVLHGVISITGNRNFRFEKDTPVTVRLTGTVTTSLHTGDKLTFDIDGSRFANFKGETSARVVPVNGRLLIDMLVQCNPAQLDFIRVTPSRLNGLPDLVEVRFFVMSGALYKIQTSTDMNVWVDVTPFPLSDSNGYIQYGFAIEPSPTGVRFYRAVVVQ